LKRYRAPIKGGYRRTTVSIPWDLAAQVTALLETRPGLTWSAYTSEALKQALASKAKRS
jgi:hypothetical protein